MLGIYSTSLHAEGLKQRSQPLHKQKTMWATPSYKSVQTLRVYLRKFQCHAGNNENINALNM
jgi:hypothetical protein